MIAGNRALAQMFTGFYDLFFSFPFYQLETERHFGGELQAYFHSFSP